MSDTSSLKFWPRLMKAKLAAAYIGTSTTHLRRLVETGLLAKPRERGGERLWHIDDLDDHADNLPRIGEPRRGDWTDQAL